MSDSTMTEGSVSEIVATPPTESTPAPAAPPRRRRRWFTVTGTVGPLGIGVTMLWLSVIVLLPLAALTVTSFEDGLAGFWDAVTSPASLASLRVTILVSVVVALINVVMGTLIAWVLVRDEFPGKRIVNAFIDLPFALPTIVASIVLLSLYGPNSPIDVQLNATQPGLVVALAFVTLPFVVRSVQPVLIETDREVEQAAASLGASNWTIFVKVVLPTLTPAIVSGAGLAFARAIGEYGSVVLIGGNIPGETQVTSQRIQQLIEIDRPVDAAAVSVALLAIAFVTLLVLRVFASRNQRREEQAS
ncbi:sulfate ABC transporter permease subunit CysT [Rhodococcus sp. NPDC058505]|uniref:sulfate ABC transporter permease subunit CysT n=1 Tax=unclassified Rhodococcus (in: high G+C Gram-positive bacteria) TaxID=192944 RepID=UPI0036568D08